MKTIPYLFCSHPSKGWPDRPTGNDHGAAARTLIRWFKLQMSPRSLSCSAYGRIYDAAGSNPYWYHFPSLGCDAPGNVVVGFSGSRLGEYIGAFWQGRRWNGTWMSRPVLLQAGRSSYNGNRWGDYSATTLDPTDSSFWTVQMYANPDPDGLWGTWITQLRVAQ
jgi:hypothetical protein